MFVNQRFINTALTLVSLLFLFAPAGVQATLTSGSWTMNQSNTFANEDDYGQVSIYADTDTGTVTFSVEAFDVQPTYGKLNNFGIQKFGFNYSDKVLAKPSTWTVTLPTGWSQDSGRMDGLGTYQVTEESTGQHRQSILDFSIQLPAGHYNEAVATNFAVATPKKAPYFFAAHIAGFANNNSHYVAGSTAIVPIPEPATIALIALGGFSFLLRRKV